VITTDKISIPYRKSNGSQTYIPLNNLLAVLNERYTDFLTFDFALKRLYHRRSPLSLDALSINSR
jgi:hypothetical protein